METLHYYSFFVSFYSQCLHHHGIRNVWKLQSPYDQPYLPRLWSQSLVLYRLKCQLRRNRCRLSRHQYGNSSNAPVIKLYRYRPYDLTTDTWPTEASTSRTVRCRSRWRRPRWRRWQTSFVSSKNQPARTPSRHRPLRPRYPKTMSYPKI